MKYCTAFIFSFLLLTTTTLASTTSGTISSPRSFAWGENAGWIDFAASSSAVTITDSALTGYAYAENLGWISLNCANTSSCGTVDAKVANNAEGVLSGNAWSENAGWIDFGPSSSGVIINSAGEFSGYAYGENIGWINFDVNEGIITDWRPLSVRSGGAVATTPSSSRSIRSGSSSGRRLTLQPTTIHSLVAVPVSMLAPTFSRDLTLGSRGNDVRALQVYLNIHGFNIASAGPGSYQQETTYFGTLTNNALARFQSAKRIVPAVGFFGPITRAVIK